MVSKIAVALAERGITMGSKVGIIANTRIEWILSDLAILSLGAISVSVYQSLTSKEIAFILHDSQAEFLFIENEEQLKKIEEIISKQWIIPATEDREELTTSISIKGIISFEDVSDTSIPLLSFTKIITDDSKPTLPNINIKRTDIASIVYTSGTTGPPKGVLQTHENHLSNVRQVLDSGLIIQNGSVYLFLPLAHSFARLFAYLSALTPISTLLPEVSDPLSSKLKPQIVLRDMANLGASIIPIVPRFLEKIKDQVQTESLKSGLKNNILKLCLWSYVGDGKTSFLGRIGRILTKPVCLGIQHKVFGKNFRYCISGGAKLSAPVYSFFDSLGIPVLEGYGLTETVVATNVCTLDKKRDGSVGPVLADDILVRIASDGEIQFKGPNIFSSYLNRPTATKKTFSDDGWFLTGDLGRIDTEGFLFVEGRKKDLIITSGGKNIAPLPIEEMLMNSVLISQAVLFGDGRKYCASLITLNPSAIKTILDIDLELDSDLNNNPDLVQAISRHISKVNKGLPSYETVKKFYLISEDFSVENGLLTPSMKVKKKLVEERYRTEIDSLF